jgi:hypothetical protein
MRSSFLLCVILTVGCGSRTLDDFVDVAGDGASTEGDGASATDTGSGGTVDDAGGTTDPDSGVIEPEDTGTVIADAGAPVDAGKTDSGSKGSSISCGMTTCDSATQECCVSASGMGVSSACTKKGACKGAVTLSCSDGKACAAGQVCCLVLDMTGGESTCAKSCGGGGGGGGSAILCSADSECPMGQTCRESRIPGVKICAPAGGGPGGG